MQTLIVLIITAFALSVFAEDDKEAEYYKEAMKQTQGLMLDKNQREQIFKESPDAQRAANKVKELAGDPKTEEEYYKLATEIFGSYKDEASMKKSISEGTRDPAAFYNSLTPEQKAKILELGKKLAPGTGLKNP